MMKKEIFNWIWNVLAGVKAGRYKDPGSHELWLNDDVHQAMRDLGDSQEAIRNRLGEWTPITVTEDTTGFDRGGGGWTAEKYASYQKRNPADKGKAVVQPSAAISTLKTKAHFEAVTRKDILPYTIKGDADKVFDFTSIRTTPAHLNKVYKEIADKVELKKIPAFHNHDALYQKIRVRRTMVQKDAAIVNDLLAEGKSDAVNHHIKAEKILTSPPPMREDFAPASQASSQEPALSPSTLKRQRDKERKRDQRAKISEQARERQNKARRLKRKKDKKRKREE